MKKIILLQIIILFFTYQSSSQWVPTSGPGGATVFALYSDSTNLYAGTDIKGFFISTNGGLSWTQHNDGLPQDVGMINISAVTKHGNYIFAGIMESSNNSIYRSSDFGLSWNVSSNGYLNFNTSVMGHTQDKIFAGSNYSPSKFYSSTDFGNTWQQVQNGIPDTILVFSFYYQNGIIYIGSSQTNNLYISSDDGNTWTSHSVGPPYSSILSVTVHNNNIFAGMLTDVFMSSNNGLNWVERRNGLPIISYSNMSPIFTFNNNIFYGIGGYGIYKSTNDGLNWNSSNVGINMFNRYENVIVTDGVRLYTGNDRSGGVYISTNNGLNWTFPNANMLGLDITGFSANNNKLFAATADCGMYFSTNYGNNWQYISSLPYALYSGLISKGDTIFTDASVLGFLYRSIDGGNNWTQINNALGVYGFGFNGIYLYAGGYTGIYLSTDNGNTWNQTYANPSYSFASNGNTVFAGSYGIILKSTNYGYNWTIVANGSPTFGIVNAILIKNNYIFASTDHKGILCSTDFGNTWSYKNNGISPQWTFDLKLYNNILFTSSDSGIFMSKNLGDNWYNINAGLNHPYTSKLIIDTPYIFAGTSDKSVWRKLLSDIITYYTVSGTVRYEDNNQTVNQGYVKALMINPVTMQVVTVDSTIIQSNGTYSLIHMPHDSTYIMAYGNDEEDFVPTYHDSTIYWQNASIIYPNSNMSNVDVKVYRINRTPGQMHIAGGVFTSSYSLTGLQNAITYVKLGNQFKAFSISGITGSYRDDSLSQNSYTVICDRIGYNGGTRNVTLASSSQDTINFYLNNIIGINPKGVPVPTSFKLYQNYPNPFNPSTTIKFDIPAGSSPLLERGVGLPDCTRQAGGFVTLKIYDLLGREVATLINENLSRGSYKVEWNASNYASGLYFYKLKAGDFTESKKLVLIK